MFAISRVPGIAIGLLIALLIGWFEPAAAQSSRAARSSRKAEAAAPDDFRSEHFLVHTDLPAAEARELVRRLEAMLVLISEYWGRPLTGIVECYVVRDLAAWPDAAFPGEAREYIERGAGVTLSQTLSRGNQFLSKSIVYAVADHGTPQHEAVHAYCMQAFGTVGPTWYSEGMAEMGNYWRADDSSVRLDDELLRYLRESEPMPLGKIVNGRQTSGDSWQAYAWRWALCHLLANNQNYASRFRPLGLALLTRERTSFEQVYGDQANEITFEYLQFLACLENGYRADLCTWDWQKRFLPLRSRTLTTRVSAGRGWQPTGALLTAGEEYEFSTAGKWRIGDERETDASGAPTGDGKLVGALFHDYQLSQPFELVGAKGSFTARDGGQLFVRCQESWGAIADNKGTITLKLKLAKR